eukprot:CAMPEP_0116883106 /NCGR_PEP_ID=MMETSP0463-20121206/15547_1 /TAXON_ID=181622 /ORGANISM="Strombidinopsis sp, Strain SopsisLIS2011" /LENGTH=88 /DNA_ID=CAMNT_0004537377 /DNA_START=449 /DNA_END=715 /DNA_ORIENTATION=-
MAEYENFVERKLSKKNITLVMFGENPSTRCKDAQDVESSLESTQNLMFENVLRTTYLCKAIVLQMTQRTGAQKCGGIVFASNAIGDTP